MTLTLHWPDQTMLVYNDDAVVTRYADGTYTGGGVVVEDQEHADLLGIRPIEHRLVHEVGHHLTSRALTKGKYGCPVLWAAAHQAEMPPSAKDLEWMVTASSYMALRGWLRQTVDAHALIKLMQAGADIERLAHQIRWVLEASRLNVESVQFGQAA